MSESRALACELVAFHYLTFLSEADLIKQLLYDLPDLDQVQESETGLGILGTTPDEDHNEASPLLDHEGGVYRPSPFRPPSHRTRSANLSASSLLLREAGDDEEDLGRQMANMNALEIAAVSDAKKFLSQKPVQGIVEAIWHGDIIFW